MGRVQVHQTAPAAVDQDRTRRHQGNAFGIYQVAVLRCQGNMERDEVTAGQQFLDSAAPDISRHLGERIVGQDLQVKGLGDPCYPAPDPAVPDNAQREPFEVAHSYVGPLLPAALPDQRGQG